MDSVVCVQCRIFMHVHTMLVIIYQFNGKEYFAVKVHYLGIYAKVDYLIFQIYESRIVQSSNLNMGLMPLKTSVFHQPNVSNEDIFIEDIFILIWTFHIVLKHVKTQCFLSYEIFGFVKLICRH